MEIEVRFARDLRTQITQTGVNRVAFSARRQTPYSTQGSVYAAPLISTDFFGASSLAKGVKLMEMQQFASDVASGRLHAF